MGGGGGGRHDGEEDKGSPREEGGGGQGDTDGMQGQVSRQMRWPGEHGSRPTREQAAQRQATVPPVESPPPPGTAAWDAADHLRTRTPVQRPGRGTAPSPRSPAHMSPDPTWRIPTRAQPTPHPRGRKPPPSNWPLWNHTRDTQGPASPDLWPSFPASELSPSMASVASLRSWCPEYLCSFSLSAGRLVSWDWAHRYSDKQL